MLPLALVTDRLVHGELSLEGLVGHERLVVDDDCLPLFLLVGLKEGV